VTLRRQLLLATAPLALAVALLGALAVRTVTSLGRTSDAILADNYRSVLAAQRMKEALERIDSAALFAASGEPVRARAQVEEQTGIFDRELRVTEQNITEPGEDVLAAELGARWQDYQTRLAACLAAGSAEAVRACYFRELEPAFLATKQAAERVLLLNQDAMVHKSERAQRAAARASALLLGAAAAALGLGAAATLLLATRIVRPLSVFGQAVEGFGRGDFAVRAHVRGRDEIAHLAHTFNAMADRIEEYRRSSLGELAQAQLAAQAAIDSLPDPVLVLAPDGGVVSANRAAEALLGAREGRAFDLSAAEGRLREAVEAARDHVLQGKGSWTARGFEDAVVVARDGVERAFLVHAEPVHEERGIVAVTVVLQDVTRLRRIEELRDDLVSTAAHQLRTPLTSLRMAIHLCLEQVPGPLNDRQQDLLYAAREECERLQSTVDELLDLARLQAGQIELRLETLDADALLESARRTHEASAETHGVSLAVDPVPCGASVRADPDRVQLVFANLIENAIRHTRSGGRIELAARPEAEAVRFEVRDEGPGVPPEHRARIFEKFVRLPGAPARGAGLGLSIARDVVRAHAGTIGVEGEPGHGSRFWFTLPRADTGPTPGGDA